MTVRTIRMGIASALSVLIVLGAVLVVSRHNKQTHTELTAYFDNSNGLFVGDDVRILGVNVGKITAIGAQPNRVKIDFWVEDRYRVPASANAVILSPAVVSARVIQLTPAYTAGPVMSSGTVIPQSRTAVPVEWDDLRTQLQNLSDSLQPTQRGGVSTLGALINTGAANLRGEGHNMRDVLIKASQAFSALGDHSGDIFGTVKNLSVLVSALSGSTDLMVDLNTRLAAVSALLVNQPNEVGAAVADLAAAAESVRQFVEQNRDGFATATERASSISQALADSIPDLKQLLHVLPNTAQNFQNIYKPAQAAISATVAIPNFSNPIQFICGAIQAASRVNAEESAKLCVQYLAPIVKNRQMNFLPLGANLLPLPIPFPTVGAMARPNEITYSEDWMRPDYNPAAAAQPPAGAATAPIAAPVAAQAPPSPSETLPAEAQQPVATDPAQGLPGLMVTAGQP